ncbi:hypothetical protein BpHYR1_033907 [Brachionus plicatilis]|uniref:Uncharacterized protein n=1 Tax=Brachionus plicatilis TaxID=10195 RepID=A0A3M7PGK7_BRAPC|nr:hypothetical protein BpHYR1_033907 [Brachionus plicatilis]
MYNKLHFAGRSTMYDIKSGKNTFIDEKCSTTLSSKKPRVVIAKKILSLDKSIKQLLDMLCQWKNKTVYRLFFKEY